MFHPKRSFKRLRENPHFHVFLALSLKPFRNIIILTHFTSVWLCVIWPSFSLFPVSGSDEIEKERKIKSFTLNGYRLSLDFKREKLQQLIPKMPIKFLLKIWPILNCTYPKRFATFLYLMTVKIKVTIIILCM